MKRLFEIQADIGTATIDESFIMGLHYTEYDKFKNALMLQADLRGIEISYEPKLNGVILFNWRPM